MAVFYALDTISYIYTRERLWCYFNERLFHYTKCIGATGRYQPVYYETEQLTQIWSFK